MCQMILSKPMTKKRWYSDGLMDSVYRHRLVNSARFRYPNMLNGGFIDHRVWLTKMKPNGKVMESSQEILQMI